MRVAITGGSGFIGTNLMLYLRRTEPETEVVIVDIATPRVRLAPTERYVYADIRNLHSLLRAFDGCEEVYHLAGILGTSELIAVSSLACETNIVGANNVMDACRMAGVKRVYNVAKPHFDGYDENSYTLTKHAGELVGRLYQAKYGMEVATVRWLNAVGPHQHLYPVRKFLPMMILCCMFDRDLEVYGDGSQTIDPIDVDDLSRFTVHAIRNLGSRAARGRSWLRSCNYLQRRGRGHPAASSIGSRGRTRRSSMCRCARARSRASIWSPTCPTGTARAWRPRSRSKSRSRRRSPTCCKLPRVEIDNAARFYWG